MTYVAYGPLGPAPGPRGLRPTCARWRRLGPVQLRLPARPGHGPEPASRTRTPSSSPSRCPGPDGEPCYAMLHRPMWDLGWFRAGRGRAPAGRDHRRAARHLDLLRAGRRGARPTSRRWLILRDHRLRRAVASTRSRSSRSAAGPPPMRVPEGWLLIHHGVTGDAPERLGPHDTRRVRLRRRGDAARPGRPRPGDRPHGRAAPRAGDRGRADRHRAQRRLPDRDRAGRRRARSSSTAWPTRRSASPGWTAAHDRPRLGGGASHDRADRSAHRCRRGRPVRHLRHRRRA